MIKNIFKYALMAACATVMLTACEEEEKIEVGDWNAVNGYADISFVQTSTSIELDPSDPTSYTLQMSRRNTAGAVSVPITITGGDTEVFQISNAEFADGDSIVDFTISFPNAEVGTTYSVQYAVADPQYTSYYSNAASGSFSVTRVKWNPAGYVVTGAGNVEGYAMYTEDFITGIYSVENVSYPVEVEERDDQHGIFRIKNPYDGKYPYNEPGDWDDSQDYYIVINATNPAKVYMEPYDFYLGLAWSYGAFVVRNLAGYRVANGLDASDYYGKYENGAITFPVNSFYIGMDDYNGGGFRWYANPNGAFRLLLDPSKDKYIAELNGLGDEGDFAWEEVFTGDFTSAKNGMTGNAKLYKATCTTTTDDANVAFEEAYGTPYVIEAPYAEGYDIYFFVKNGRITMPADFAEDFEMQPIGLDDNMGNDIYAKINPSSSSFSETEVILNLTFVNEDESITYGTANETLANITWTPVGTGTYTYVAWEEDEAEPDPGYVLSKRDDKDNVYRIEEWFYGVNLVFTWDKATNKCQVDEQFTGYTHPSYGDVYVCDGPTFSSQLADQPVLFDPATSTFKFYLVYYCSAGVFARDVDTFQVEFSESGVKAISHDKSYKQGKAIKMPWQRQSRWQGKKYQKADPRKQMKPVANLVF